MAWRVSLAPALPPFLAQAEHRQRKTLEHDGSLLLLLSPSGHTRGQWRLFTKTPKATETTRSEATVVPADCPVPAESSKMQQLGEPNRSKILLAGRQLRGDRRWRCVVRGALRSHVSALALALFHASRFHLITGREEKGNFQDVSCSRRLCRGGGHAADFAQNPPILLLPKFTPTTKHQQGGRSRHHSFKFQDSAPKKSVFQSKTTLCILFLKNKSIEVTHFTWVWGGRGRWLRNRFQLNSPQFSRGKKGFKIRRWLQRQGDAA